MKKLEAYKIEFNENALAKFTLDREKLVSLRKNINTLKKTVKGLESHYNELSKVQLV
jgi:arsenate reductase-like glutaredoxin family protein